MVFFLNKALPPLGLTFAQVPAETLGVVDGLFSGGVGIEVGPHVLHLQLQLGLAPSLGALEDHVLQEVGYAVRLLIFVAATSIDP